MKMKLTGLMLTAMLLMAGGAAGVEATAYTATGTGAPTCTGAITIAANGVVTCAAEGLQLLSSCAGNIVIDSEGVARCSAAAVAPACTLTQSLFAGQTRLTANCTPAATSYTWSANTGFASTDSGGFVSPAQTTTYTVRGTNAAGSGNTASLTVTVGSTTTGKPICSLSASPTTISAGSSVTLTASCSPAAASYIWTGSGCAGNASTCTASPASSTTYSVSGLNAAGTGNPASATVTVIAVSAPPSCTLTQSLFVGQTRLTANCTPAATSYTWSANTGFASTDSGGFVSPAQTTTYTVRGTNAAGSGNTASLTITVAAPTPSCALTANPAAIDKDGSSTLTASCNPAATSYAWTGSGCTAQTGNTCTVTLAAVGGTTYTVAGSNAAGTGSPVSATVTVAKPSCTVTANPASIAPGASSVLTANCSPSVGTTYLWTGGACAGATTLTCDTGNLNVSTDYTVTGSNSLGGSNPASATVTVAKPTCTLTASPASVGRGKSSTLTASCSPAATEGYNWDGICAGSSTSCTVTPMVAGVTTYTVRGTNLAGISDPASATVTAAAPSCTLTAAPSTVSPNSASTLTASCTPAADSYAWAGGTCAGKTTSTCTVTPDATTAYSVTGSDLVGAGNTANATVSVLADPGCPNGYTYTVVPITWAPQISIKGPKHTMNHCEVKAFQFTMPSRPPMQSQTSYGDVPKYMSMSQTAFDFSPSLEASGCAAAGQNNPIIWHSTEAPMSGVCAVTTGATYYLNVRNADSRDGPDNCPAGMVCQYYLAW